MNVYYVFIYLYRFAKNCYAADAWTLEGTDVLLNLPSNKSCRAPGTTQVS